jgi:AcrR family transcriptional regulator
MSQVESVWTREDRKRRSTLSRAAIVKAAMAIADTEGIEAVSIRRVATELGARAMSLYTYIERKEDLFDLMADEVAAETLVDGPLPPDWRDATVAIARRERASAQRHPWIITLVARRDAIGSVGPNMLRHLEQSIEALAGLDADATWKWRLMTAVSDYSTGFILREARERSTPHTVLELQAARLGDFPRLAGMLAAADPDLDDGNFEQGLRWLLDGIAQTSFS